MRRLLTSVLFLALTAGTLSYALSAQDVPRQELKVASGTFPEAFSIVSGLRELPDGRLLVADALGEVLAVVDLAAGTADTIGRRGRGPGEYIQPDGVFPLPGDSTLLVDLGNGRLTVLGPDLAFGETSPIAVTSGQGMVLVLPRGVDDRGRVYFQPSAMGGGVGRRGLPDSAVVARWDRATGAIDTLARVKLADMSVQRSGSGNNSRVQITQRPLSPQDGWGVGLDGRLALARSGDYRLDLLSGDEMLRGRAVPYRPVPIRRRDKEEWAEGSSNGLSIRMEVNNSGARQVSLGRGGPQSGNRPDIDALEWPDTKPPFVANDVFVAPDGSTWIRRSVAAGDQPLFDVFDDRTNFVGQVVLPAGRRVVGFGRDVVYLAARDEFDLEWLEEYQRPKF